MLPPGERTSTPAGRIVPIHTGSDAKVATIGVPAQAATTSGIEELFRDVLRGVIADSRPVAILGPDGAIAAALHVLFHLNVSADRVVIAVREPRHDHHDRNRFLSRLGGNAAVRRTEAVAATALHQRNVGDNMDHVGHVGDEGFQVDDGFPRLARRVAGKIHHSALILCSTRHRRRVMNGRHGVGGDQEEEENENLENARSGSSFQQIEPCHVVDVETGFETFLLASSLFGETKNTEI